MNKELIEKINKQCPYQQGIFFQPFGVPDSIQEHVIYSSYNSGGMSGGSCWGDTPIAYTETIPKDRMKVLDIVLTEFAPNISYLQYKRVEALMHSNQTSQWEYYGNSTDSVIEYILLSELEELLKEINVNKP